MKSIRMKITVAIVICSLITASIISLLSISDTRELSNAAAEKELVLTCENTGEEINALISRIEQSVGTLSDIAMRRLEFSKFKNNNAYESKYTNKYIYDKGMSYISYDGKTWTDLYELKLGSAHSQVACIKAFTTLETLNTVISMPDYSIESGKIVTLEANVLDAHNNRVTLGSVTFNIDGNEYVVDVNDGKATFNYRFSNETNSGGSALAALPNSISRTTARQKSEHFCRAQDVG